MRRILFVHNLPTRFVQIDQDLLTQRYLVTELYEKGLRQIHPLRINQAVKAHDLVFCWFASWHSLLPVMMARFLQKPSIVVIGGYDTANLPEAGYGSQRGGFRRLIARTVISNATHLIAISRSAQQEAVTNAQADPTKITVIYCGMPSMPMSSLTNRESLVLTVGSVWRENLLRKGLLPFVKAAAHFPEVRFVHVGKWHDDSIQDLRRAASPNVEFMGFIPDESLSDLYRRASVYVQASLHEGFGMSVAEAMLVGCIPVVARSGSLPEVVGETGVYTASNDPMEVATAIRQALAWDGPARQRARQRILTQFPIDRRRQALLSLIECFTS